MRGTSDLRTSGTAAPLAATSLAGTVNPAGAAGSVGAVGNGNRRTVADGTSARAAFRDFARPARGRRVFASVLGSLGATATLRITAIAGAAAITLGTAPATAQTYAIRGGTVHTLAAEPFTGIVVVRDGLIAAVGPDMETPADAEAEIVDAAGRHVYPGLFDAVSRLGLIEIGAVSVTNDAREQGGFNPHLQAATAIHPASEHIPVARANGIAATLSVPQGGVIAGQASLVGLDGWTVEEMLIDPGAAMVVNYPSLAPGFGNRGDWSDRRARYDEAVARLDQWLDAARDYRQAIEAGAGVRRDTPMRSISFPPLAASHRGGGRRPPRPRARGGREDPGGPHRQAHRHRRRPPRDPHAGQRAVRPGPPREHRQPAPVAVRAVPRAAALTWRRRGRRRSTGYSGSAARPPLRLDRRSGRSRNSVSIADRNPPSPACGSGTSAGCSPPTRRGDSCRGRTSPAVGVARGQFLPSSCSSMWCLPFAKRCSWSVHWRARRTMPAKVAVTAAIPRPVPTIHLIKSTFISASSARSSSRVT